MNLSDFGQLRKLMQMTTSPNDHEALVAVRKANALLERNHIDWEKVFARTVTVEDDLAGWAEDVAPKPRAPAARTQAQRIEELLVVCEGSATGRFADFVASLREQFDRTGRLSTLQVESLERSAERAARR